MKTPKVTAIIPAGGRGTRLRSLIEKQFVELAGHPLIYYTLLTLQQCEKIHHLIVVVPEDRIDYTKTNIVNRYEFSKIKKVVAGGKTRQESIWNGLQVLPADTEIVIVHDAARPFASMTLFEDSIAACQEYTAVITAINATDTVKIARDKFVEKTIDRNDVWLVQTPQTYITTVLKTAYQKAQEDGFIGTDDAALVERIGQSIRIIPGEKTNIKITTKIDFDWASLFISSKYKEI